MNWLYGTPCAYDTIPVCDGVAACEATVFSTEAEYQACLAAAAEAESICNTNCDDSYEAAVAALAATQRTCAGPQPCYVEGIGDPDDPPCTGCEETYAYAQAACTGTEDEIQACLTAAENAFAICVGNCNIAYYNAMAPALEAYNACYLPCCQNASGSIAQALNACVLAANICYNQVTLDLATCLQTCIGLNEGPEGPCGTGCANAQEAGNYNCLKTYGNGQGPDPSEAWGGECNYEAWADDMQKEQAAGWLQTQCHTACELPWLDAIYGTMGCVPAAQAAYNGATDDAGRAEAYASFVECLGPLAATRFNCRMACCENLYGHDPGVDCYAACWQSSNCKNNAGFPDADAYGQGPPAPVVDGSSSGYDCTATLNACLARCPEYVGPDQGGSAPTIGTCSPCITLAGADFEIGAFLPPDPLLS